MAAPGIPTAVILTIFYPDGAHFTTASIPAGVQSLTLSPSQWQTSGPVPQATSQPGQAAGTLAATAASTTSQPTPLPVDPLTSGRNSSSSTSTTKSQSASSSSGPTSASHVSLESAPPHDEGKPTTSESTGRGLIAASSVLGVLFLLALAGLLFLWFRQRRRSRRDATYAEPDEMDKSSISHLEQTVEALKLTLSERDAQLRNNQAAMLRAAHRNITSINNLDDKEVSNRFQQLSKAVNDWVLTYFRKFKTDSQLTADLEPLLEKRQLNQYEALLQDSRTKYLVIRMIVGDALALTISNGDFLGASYTNLQQVIARSASEREFCQWRMQTVALLSNDEEHSRVECSITAENIATHIDMLTKPFADKEWDESRISGLEQIVDAASRLSIELARQGASYQVIMEEADSRFSSATMEDVFQEQKGDILEGRPVRAVVFPTVIRFAGEDGPDAGESVVILKGQVLV
ncbi:MAG: hypothetical protein M1837_007010 [Sclerophora amabilis]|nr:MAG: hypothetical protein M1837_007010 [Sclerophora amabilis]